VTGPEGGPERFLGLYHCLLRRNIEFAHPYPLRDNCGIYHPSTLYRTTGPCTGYMFPSQLYLYTPRNRVFSAIDRLVKSYWVEEAVQVEVQVEAARVEAARVEAARVEAV
jgi:hypothetical protein